MFVFRIRIRIRRIRMFLGLPDPYPFQKCHGSQPLENAVGTGRVPLLRGLPTGLRHQPGIERDGRLQPRQTGTYYRRGRISAKSVYGSETELLERMQREYHRVHIFLEMKQG